MNKKILVGCGVLLLLAGITAGSCVFMFYQVKETAGDMLGHMRVAMQMPLERMEQDAVKLSATDLMESIKTLAGQPVKVRGVSVSLSKATGQAPPPGMDVNNALVLEPGVLVTAMVALPKGARKEGVTLDVLGIATFIKTEDPQGRPLVMILAKDVEVVDVEPAAAPAQEAPVPAPAP